MLRSKAHARIEVVDGAHEPWQRKLYRGVWLLTVIGLLFAGLISLGFWLRQQVRPLDLYSLRFDRIDCPDPPGRKHAEFLGEVRYLGELPEMLTILDENAVQRVAGAFGKHPWVEKVIRVDLDLRRPRAQLVFRTPVLVIAQTEHGALRARVIDRSATVLPADASGEGLPRYWMRDNTPMCPAGQRCLLPNIKTVASTAGYLHDFLLPWQMVSLEGDVSGLSLTSINGTRILWGRAPGLELATEALAASKRDWLRAYFDAHGTDKGSAVLLDVRGPTEMTVQPIPLVGARPR